MGGGTTWKLSPSVKQTTKHKRGETSFGVSVFWACETTGGSVWVSSNKTYVELRGENNNWSHRDYWWMECESDLRWKKNCCLSTPRGPLCNTSRELESKTRHDKLDTITIKWQASWKQRKLGKKIQQKKQWLRSTACAILLSYYDMVLNVTDWAIKRRSTSRHLTVVWSESYLRECIEGWTSGEGCMIIQI